MRSHEVQAGLAPHFSMLLPGRPSAWPDHQSALLGIQEEADYDHFDRMAAGVEEAAGEEELDEAPLKSMEVCVCV